MVDKKGRSQGEITRDTHTHKEKKKFRKTQWDPEPKVQKPAACTLDRARFKPPATLCGDGQELYLCSS